MLRLNFFNNYYTIYFVFLTLAIFSPKLSAVDNVSLRWLMVSIANFLFISHLYLTKKTVDLRISLQLKLFISLFLISIISIIFSINLVESIVSINKIFIILSTLICFSLITHYDQKLLDKLTLVIVLSIVFESIYVYYDLLTSDSTFSGVSMNRNISAFSILLKLPIFFLFRLKNPKNYNLLYLFLELFIISSIILLESRGAILCLSLIYFFKIFLKNETLQSLFKFCGIIFFLILYVPYSNFLSNKQFVGSQILGDESVSLRIDFFSNSWDYFLNNPIFGNGIGMWKIISNQMSIGQVPYYVHNDFLQFLVETGILGLICYLLFFLSLLYIVVKKWNPNTSIYFLFIIFIFFFDSLINFPFHRPQQIIVFTVIVSAFIIPLNSYKKEINKGILLILLPLISASAFSSFKELNASFNENKFRIDLINKQYTINKEDIGRINYKFPNLSSNTVPFSSYISRYYLHQQDYIKADMMIDYGIEANPYLSYSKDLKLESLLTQSKFLDALEEVKSLLSNRVNSELYFDIFFTLSQQLNLENEFINIYPLISKIGDEALTVQYFSYYNNLMTINKDKFIELISKAIIQFPQSSELKILLFNLKN